MGNPFFTSYKEPNVAADSGSEIGVALVFFMPIIVGGYILIMLLIITRCKNGFLSGLIQKYSKDGYWPRLSRNYSRLKELRADPRTLDAIENVLYMLAERREPDENHKG